MCLSIENIYSIVVAGLTILKVRKMKSVLKFLALSYLLFSTQVNAQEIIGIQEQLDAIKEEIMILQRKVYRDSATSSVYESNPARAEVKIGEYDEVIRNINGKVEELEYKIVGSTEANSLKGKISNESPVGKALMGKKVGDMVTVVTQAGEISYKVLEIYKAN